MPLVTVPRHRRHPVPSELRDRRPRQENIEDYMVEKLGIDESKIENLGNLLY